MNPNLIILVLLIFILFREVISQYNSHILLNKIMSKNYWEYAKAETVTHQNIIPKKEDDDEPLEDFSNISF